MVFKKSLSCFFSRQEERIFPPFYIRQSLYLFLAFSVLIEGKANAMIMGEDYAANNRHFSSHAETETPMIYDQLHGNPAHKINKKILDRALGLPKPPRPPMAGITNLPGAAFPSYSDIPLLEPYPGAKVSASPQPPAPPPYPGGPSAPGLYGNHSITKPNIL